jgi:hypothetical protein
VIIANIITLDRVVDLNQQFLGGFFAKLGNLITMRKSLKRRKRRIFYLNLREKG